MSAAQPKPQPAGIPYLTIFGIVGTAVGIISFVQGISSSIRRRRFKGAEEEFLRYVESNKVISESLSQVEQYQKAKDSLRNEIETQIPKQARIAYLSNRLEQLKDDLHRSYREYEGIRKELSRDHVASELDQSIRDAVTASTPQRRVQESRNLYMLTLVILLLVFNVLPIGPNNYFRIVGNSIEYNIATLAAVMLAGGLCLIPVWLLLLSFVSNNNTVLWRFQRISAIRKKASLGLLLLIPTVAVIIGFYYWNIAWISYFYHGVYNGNWINYAEAAFNISVVSFSIVVAIPISLWQRRTTAR